MRILAFAINAFLMAVSAVHAEEIPVELLGAEIPAGMEETLTNAVLLHRKAVEGDKDAVKEAIALLEPVVDQDNAPPISIGFMGSLYTLRGRDASNVVNAMRFTNRGIGMIDKAVDLQPNGYSIRMLRALNNIEIPAMFGRHDVAIADMKFIIDTYQPENQPCNADSVKVVLGHLIKNANAMGDDAGKARYQTMLDSLN